MQSKFSTNTLNLVVMRLQEASQRPGMMSLAGKRRERLCRKDVERYFRRLKAEVLKLNLQKMGSESWTSPATAAHAAEIRLRLVVRRLSPYLLGALATHLYHGALEGAKVGSRYRKLHFKEADDDQPATPAEVKKALTAITPDPGFISDAIGLTGQEAADYAAERSATQVVGINKTTLEKLQKVISDGIEEQLGTQGLGREIRAAMDHMTVYRSQMIATTEMADAFSWSSLKSMKGFGVEYKQWVVAPDCCDECEELDEEVVAVDDVFSAGVSQPPLHPNCRCAVVPARPPAGEDAGTEETVQ